MKIAYIINAHHQPAHLFRLVSSLNYPGTNFFIHIDLKQDLNDFLCYPYDSNVYFINERLRTAHCGFLITKATFLLMKKAVSEDDFEYFIFITGSDYPIKSNFYIHNFLKQNYPNNFISFYPLIPQADMYYTITRYHFIEVMDTLPNFLNFPFRIIRQIINFLLPKRKFVDGFQPYRGSAQFCLNNDTVKYILRFMESTQSKNYIKFFKNVFSPDEIFYHTIIFNSEYADQCNGYQEHKTLRKFLKNENKAYLHFIDWDPKRENPALLDISDFSKIKESKYLFARKFDENKSKDLLELIDKELLTENAKSL